MRVVLTINTIPEISSGVGGHYNSALTTTDALTNAGHEALLVHFGSQMSPLVGSWNGLKTHIPWPSGNTLSAFKQFWIKSKIFSPDLIISFDRHTYLHARIYSLLNRIPLILVIPEGFYPPASDQYFPHATNAVLFAREQFSRCASHPATSRANIIFAPNRVLEFTTDHARIFELRKKLDPDALVVLRICRLNQQYERSARQTIEAARRLRNAGTRAQALIVGMPLDARVVQRLAGLAGSEDIIITDPSYYTNASALVEIADVVVGTGRSFMEAAAKGRVMMTPALDLDVPYLIDANEFETAFASNFSPRVTFPEVSNEQATESMTAMLSSSSERQRLQLLARHWFESYFDARSLSSIYDTARHTARLEGLESALNVPHHMARVLYNLARNKRRLRQKQSASTV